MESVHVIVLVTFVFVAILPFMNRLVHLAIISITTPWMFLFSYSLFINATPSPLYIAYLSEGFAWCMTYFKASIPALLAFTLWAMYIDRCLKEAEKKE